MRTRGGAYIVYVYTNRTRCKLYSSHGTQSNGGGLKYKYHIFQCEFTMENKIITYCRHTHTPLLNSDLRESNSSWNPTPSRSVQPPARASLRTPPLMMIKESQFPKTRNIILLHFETFLPRNRYSAECFKTYPSPVINTLHRNRKYY